MISATGGALRATDLQKLLFLYVNKWEDVPSFKFVPHRFGCFSFQAAADLESLSSKGCIKSNPKEGWKLTRTGQSVVKPSQVGRLKVFSETTVPERGDALISRLYREYPYFACRSSIVDRVVKDASIQKNIRKALPNATGTALFTLGYERDSIDGYLNRLIQNNVKLLCDVRKNPLSRKTGFSKRSLASFCERVDVDYIHMPELGIPGHRRRELNSQADYDALFEEYEREDLPLAADAIQKLGELLMKYNRIALTCFEKEPESCHRHCVAEEMQRVLPGCPEIQHI